MKQTTTTVKNGHFKISSGPLASHSISFSVYNNQNLKIELIPGGRRRTSSAYAFSFFTASSKAQGECSTRALCKVLQLLQITRMREILTLFVLNENLV